MWAQEPVFHRPEGYSNAAQMSFRGKAVCAK
jgi:hypothetical protein